MKWQEQGAWQNEGDRLRRFGSDRPQHPVRRGLLTDGAPPPTSAAAAGGAQGGAARAGLSSKGLALL
eukprot:9503119-Pyramimonas_sp.AAC.1